MKPLLKFIPLAVLYFLIIIFFNNEDLIGDEKRYVNYAENLIHGYYTSTEDPSLRNGPWYPILLTPFIGLEMPYLIPRLLNGIFLLFAVFYFEKAAKFFLTDKVSTILAFSLGLYYPIYRWLPRVQTDVLTLFLICAMLYFLLKALSNKQFKLSQLILPGILLGMLILTKFIFGYVAITFIAITILYFALFRDRRALKLSLFSIVGYLFVIPYLFYTYSLTQRNFYFGTNGGEQIYWMSSKLEHEYGNWFGVGKILEKDNKYVDESHYEFYRSVVDLSQVEKNDAFKKKGIERIKQNPLNYGINVATNVVRILFNYPNSYRFQDYDALFYILINIPLLTFLMLSIYPALLNANILSFEILFLTLFALIYFGGTILIIGSPRYFIPVLPFILLWLGYIYSNFVQIRIVKK